RWINARRAPGGQRGRQNANDTQDRRNTEHGDRIASLNAEPDNGQHRVTYELADDRQTFTVGAEGGLGGELIVLDKNYTDLTSATTGSRHDLQTTFCGRTGS